MKTSQPYPNTHRVLRHELREAGISRPGLAATMLLRAFTKQPTGYTIDPSAAVWLHPWRDDLVFHHFIFHTPLKKGPKDYTTPYPGWRLNSLLWQAWRERSTAIIS